VVRIGYYSEWREYSGLMVDMIKLLVAIIDELGFVVLNGMMIIKNGYDYVWKIALPENKVIEYKVRIMNYDDKVMVWLFTDYLEHFDNPFKEFENFVQEVALIRLLGDDEDV